MDIFSVVGIPGLDSEVSELARNVKKGGKIAKGANFILKEFKSLRIAANVLNRVKLGTKTIRYIFKAAKVGKYAF